MVELSKFMNSDHGRRQKAVYRRIIYVALELIERKHPDKESSGSLHRCHQQREAHGGSRSPAALAVPTTGACGECALSVVLALSMRWIKGSRSQRGEKSNGQWASELLGNTGRPWRCHEEA